MTFSYHKCPLHCCLSRSPGPHTGCCEVYTGRWSTAPPPACKSLDKYTKSPHRVSESPFKWLKQPKRCHTAFSFIPSIWAVSITITDFPQRNTASISTSKLTWAGCRKSPILSRILRSSTLTLHRIIF